MGDFRYLDELLENFVQKGPAGCGCMVMQDEQVLYEGYHGYADLASKRPIDADTAVSYTHLDVYKRQALECSKRAHHASHIRRIFPSGNPGTDRGYFCRESATLPGRAAAAQCGGYGDRILQIVWMVYSGGSYGRKKDLLCG